MKTYNGYSEFQQIFDSLDMAVIVMDLNGNIEYFNRKMKEIISRHSKTEGGKCYELCHGIWSETGRKFCSWCGISDVGRSGQAVNKIIKGTGEKHWLFSWAPIRNRDYAIVKVVKTISDITEQIREREYLESILMDIFSIVRIGIIILDGESRVIFLNHAVEQRWGINNNQVVNLFFSELEFYNHNTVFKHAIENAHNGIRSDAIEMEIKSHNVQTFQISVDIIPFKKDDTGWQVIILEQDITKIFNEKEVAKRDLKDKEAKLLERDKLAAVGQLAAGIAHELNTPTTYVRGNMQTFGKYTTIIADLVSQLHDNISDSEKDVVLDRMEKLISNMKEIAQSSFNGTSRIMKIISSMKSFVRAKHNTASSINIYAPVQDALILIFNRIKYIGSVFVNGIDITINDINLVNTFPAINIQGSDSRLTQLFIILFNNSIDAWESKEDKKSIPLRIDINITHQKNILKTEVSDNAGGIPDKLIDKIFEPFYTTKSNIGGTGLGLSVAMQIAAEHGTALAVRNIEKKGVSFKMEFKIQKKECADSGNQFVEGGSR